MREVWGGGGGRGGGGRGRPRRQPCLLPFSSTLSTRVTGIKLGVLFREEREATCLGCMYSSVSSMITWIRRRFQRATTTTGSLPSEGGGGGGGGGVSQELVVRCVEERVRIKMKGRARSPSGTRYPSGRLTEFCRKCESSVQEVLQ